MIPVHTFSLEGAGTATFERLPIVPGASYHFQLATPGRASMQVTRAIPNADEQVHVDLRSFDAHAMSVRVVSEEGLPLVNALVTASWDSEGNWCKLEQRTDASGLTAYSSIPSGAVWLRAAMGGFASRLLPDPTIVEDDIGDPITIQLKQAGQLSGRCEYKGQPVEDFAVFVWGDDVDSFAQVAPDPDRKGHFSTDEAPIGLVHVLATSDTLPNAETQVVTVAEGTTPTVVCQFESPLLGRARIVDALTLNPIAGAAAQLWNASGPAAMGFRGGEHISDAHGVVSMENLGPGLTPCRITAAGYATRILELYAESVAEVDLGAIAMYRRQSVTVQLVGVSPLDADQYIARLSGALDSKVVQFGPNAQAVFDQIEPGLLTLTVQFPGRFIEFSEVVNVMPGADASIAVPVEGHRVLVDIVCDEGASLDAGSRLVVSTPADWPTWSAQNYPVRRGSPVEIRVLKHGRTGLTVTDRNDKVRAMTECEIRDDGPARIEVRVGNTQRQVMVVDKSGDPVSEATVFVTNGPGGANASLQLRANQGGICDLPSIQLSKTMVAAFHENYGLSASRPVDLGSSTEKCIIVKLDPAERIDITLLERQVPAAGVRVVAEDLGNIGWGLGERTTELSGNVSWQPVSNGDYRIAVMHPGWWRTVEIVHLTDGKPIPPIQVRRLGSVAFDVRSVLGNAVAGARIDVRSEEMDTWASKWVEAGIVSPSRTDLASDSGGHFRLDGLPNGDFEWRVTPVTGDPLTGRVNVPPMGVATVEVRVP